MAISISYGPNAVSLSQLARATGRGQLATQQQQVDNANQRYLLGLQEQQRQFDTQTANAAYNAQAARDMQRQQMAASQAAQQQALAANVFNQQAARQANIYGQELDYDTAQQNRDAQWQIKSVDSAEQMAKDALLAANKLKLDPEGKRKLAQLASDFRAIAAQRGVSIRDGAPYEGVLKDWLSDFDNSALDDHEEREPSQDERWAQGTRTDADGAVYGLDRSGSWRKLRDGTYQPPGGEDRFELPDGGFAKWNPYKGEYEEFGGAAKADPNMPKPLGASEKVRIRQQVFDEELEVAKAEYQARKLAGDLDAKFQRPDPAAIEAEYQRRLAQYSGAAGAESNYPTVTTREEAAAKKPGEFFYLNGQLYEVIAPGQYEAR